jgi:hypothetical protein
VPCDGGYPFLNRLTSRSRAAGVQGPQCDVPKLTSFPSPLT